MRSVRQHQVQDHRNPPGMCLVNQCPQVIRLAIAFFHSKEISWIIAPAQVSFELEDGHQFNRVNTQVTQIVQALQHAAE